MDKKQRGLVTGSERRTFASKVECRSNGKGGYTLVGYASTTEQPYEMYDMFGPYSEVISRGAFKRTLNNGPKVQLLVNHGGLSLAQTTSGTLRLSEDDTGLLAEADLNPKRSDAADLIAALDDGAVDEMSFAFRVESQQWSPDYEERRINEVNLNRGDVSVVNLGANPNTSVAMRAQDVRMFFDSIRRSDMSADDMRAMLTTVLGQVAAVDSIVDDIQGQLAAALGVPNPDDEQETERGMSLDMLRALSWS